MSYTLFCRSSAMPTVHGNAHGARCFFMLCAVMYFSVILLVSYCTLRVLVHFVCEQVHCGRLPRDARPNKYAALWTMWQGDLLDPPLSRQVYRAAQSVTCCATNGASCSARCFISLISFVASVSRVEHPLACLALLQLISRVV